MIALITAVAMEVASERRGAVPADLGGTADCCRLVMQDGVHVGAEGFVS